MVDETTVIEFVELRGGMTDTALLQSRSAHCPAQEHVNMKIQNGFQPRV
jgi:hypothetical protein